jgi:hypothetical protein
MEERTALQHNEPLAQLIRTWQKEAKLLEERYGQIAQAHLTRQHANDLEETLNNTLNATLSLTQAAAITGYSRDHLGKLVGAGKLRNHGTTKARPLVKLNELPRKPALHNAEAPAISSRRYLARAVVNHQTEEA